MTEKLNGDPVVDRLMRPVMTTIEQHVKNQAAIFHIYNRAYEAVMNSMTVIDTMREQLSKSNAENERLRAENGELWEMCKVFGKYASHQWSPGSNHEPRFMDKLRELLKGQPHA